MQCMHKTMMLANSCELWSGHHRSWVKAWRDRAHAVHVRIATALCVQHPGCCVGDARTALSTEMHGPFNAAPSYIQAVWPVSKWNLETSVKMFQL